MAISTDTTIASAIPRVTSLPPRVDSWGKGVPLGFREALERLRAVRGLFEAAIADAIDQLDLLDMEAEDLEDDGEAGRPSTLDEMNPIDSEDSEPSLAAPEQHTSSIHYRDGAWHTLQADQTRWAAGVADDREGNLADHGDDREGRDVLDDGEEPLGWCENVSQKALGPNMADGDSTAPERHGRGFVRCGRDDYEPSLGSGNLMIAGAGSSIDQRGWGCASTADLELDPAECGIADEDGRTEQMMRHHGIIVGEEGAHV